MLPFCEPGDSYSVLWVENGLSRCFSDILGSLSAGGVLFLVGLTVLTLSEKPKTKGPLPWLPLSQSKLFIAEVVASCFYALTFVADLILKGCLVGDQIYGYVIVVDVTSLCAWLFSVVVIFRERLSVLYGMHHGLALVCFWLLNTAWLCAAIVSWNSPHWWWGLDGALDIADLVLFCVRVCLILALVSCGVFRPLCTRQSHYRLLINGDEPPPEIPSQSVEDPDKSGSFSRKSSQGSAFKEMRKKLRLMYPFVWPKGHLVLQSQVIVCFLLLIAGRVINVLLPIYYKKIVNALTPYPNTTDALDARYGFASEQYGVTFPLVSILVYMVLRLLQGGGVAGLGVCNNLRSFLWIGVQQYTTRIMQVELFDHLHGLSLRWHLGRKTGEVLRVMDRGTQSINNLLSYVLFSVLPAFADIGVAVVYFVIAFDAWFGLIVFTTMTIYLLSTIHVQEWRTKFRRVMNERDNVTRAKGVDSLLNFETVKYYSQERFEVDRFNDSIVDYQKAEWKSLSSLNLLNTSQNIIINIGLLCGSLLCAYRVTQGSLTVGDYVLFTTYILQLYAPLNYFGTYYRLIQQCFIDMENVFDLLGVNREVQDVAGAQPLRVSDGCIEFRNVYFHYTPERPILRDISFTVNAGETVALVGPTGAGKSTIVRLLFRFYDIQDGSIFIDGQDIRRVKQSSLRENIGVVPQDTVLFNDDIRYNIRYGKVTADDNEVERAAQYADIHDKILTFPKQYETIVGERGLKLSGGEKQRVAIARTILKSPRIILLDEATSALDTRTERNIQASLMRVCQGRTTIIVAHRLSTIIHAHQILVIKDGGIVERGTHEELLAAGGEYASMWLQQQESLQQDDDDVTVKKDETEL